MVGRGRTNADKFALIVSSGAVNSKASDLPAERFFTAKPVNLRLVLAQIAHVIA